MWPSYSQDGYMKRSPSLFLLQKRKEKNINSLAVDKDTSLSELKWKESLLIYVCTNDTEGLRQNEYLSFSIVIKFILIG